MRKKKESKVKMIELGRCVWTFLEFQDNFQSIKEIRVFLQFMLLGWVLCPILLLFIISYKIKKICEKCYLHSKNKGKKINNILRGCLKNKAC